MSNVVTGAGSPNPVYTGTCNDQKENNASMQQTALHISNAADQTSLSLSNRGLETIDLERCIVGSTLQSYPQLSTLQTSLLPMFPPSMRSIVRLDLSRNNLNSLPKEIFGGSLEFLNVGRNKLKELPPEIGNCKCLKEIIALSNNLRWSGFPVDSISSLPFLEVLDLRWNKKMNSQSTRKRLLELFQRADHKDQQKLVNVILSSKNDDSSGLDTTTLPKKLSACDRDANELRSQLEPLSTPQLRKRLFRTFDVKFDDHDESSYDREVLMQRLLSCYRSISGCEKNVHPLWMRSVRHESGVALDPALVKELVQEMEAIRWPRTTRERPKISAEGYVILQRPLPSASTTNRTTAGAEIDPLSQKASNKAKREAEKLKRFMGIWTKALEAIETVDKIFAQQFTALAVTMNFRGSPHIDTLNIAPFYGLALGDFTGGGKLCVECSATEVAEIDTRGRLAKVDGRFCHWVSDYEGTRYSLIYYVTHGDVVPQTTAIFRPPRAGDGGEDGDDAIPWVPPPSHVA